MNTSQAWRLLVWVGSIFGALGLVISLVDWWHGSLVFAGPKLVDQIGMLVLASALLLSQVSIEVRNKLIVLATILIVPSTILILWRAL
jgi:hypothetical protein